jgi:NAD(P)-dependent dehydrogenase (short-subunit alcohol dehydrogenase family)
MEYEGRIAIVTGSGRGIGAGIARVLAKNGAHVIVAEINPASGENTVRNIMEHGGSATFIEADISDMDSIKNLFDLVIERFGKVDFLVNNVGIAAGKPLCKDMTKEDWDRTVKTNLTGTFFCTQRAAEEMAKRKFGKIVQVSSISAHYGGIISGADYVSTKAGIIGMTKTFARDYGPLGLNVNCITPGTVLTELLASADPELVAKYAQGIGLKRHGTPEEIGETVKFLCGEGGAYFSGATLDVCGGVYYR